MEDDKVFEALQVIKEYCGEQESNCEGCKLYYEDGGCALTNYVPDEWKINVNKKYKFIL